MIPNLIGVRKSVLDQGWIELVDMMPHPLSEVSPDMAVVNAARVSFLQDSKGEAADKKLLRYMLKNGHTSPFEQVQFKFRCHAPLVTWWQWVRHRTWSFNAQSGRYTEFEENCFYFPHEWRLQSQSNKQGSEGFLASEGSEILDVALATHYHRSYDLYQRALALGVAKEQARIFLPGFSVYYTWVMSIDAHNLMHFLKLRMDAHAQYEIRVYADTIYQEFFKFIMPWTSEIFEELYIEA